MDEAIAAHKQAIALAPKSAELRAELAGLYARTDKAQEAIDTAQDAARARSRTIRKPTRSSARSTPRSPNSASRSQPGDNPADYPARAIAALEKARADDAFDINLDLMLGRLYAQTGRSTRRCRCCGTSWTTSRGYQEGALLLAAAQESAGQADDAIETLRETLRMQPGLLSRSAPARRDRRARREVGRSGRRAREGAGAQPAQHRRSLPRRAIALINAGKAGEARAHPRRSWSTASASPDAAIVYLLAEAQRADKDLPAAEATARKLLAANPDDKRGLHALSLDPAGAGRRQGRRGDAARSRQPRTRRTPTRSIRSATCSPSAAIGWTKRCSCCSAPLKIDPENPSFLDSLGWAYFQQGRLTEADQPLTQAAEQLQISSVVQEHLGDLRFKQQRFADAATAWERALSGDGQSVDRAKIEKKIRDARARLAPQ